MIPAHRTSPQPTAKTMLQWQRVTDKLHRLAETQPKAAAVVAAGVERALDILADDTKGGA